MIAAPQVISLQTHQPINGNSDNEPIAILSGYRQVKETNSMQKSTKVTVIKVTDITEPARFGISTVNGVTRIVDISHVPVF